MRLLHVIHTLNPASGGTAEAVRSFVSHQGKSKQSVLTLDRPSDPWINGYGADLHCVGRGKGNYGLTGRLPKWLQKHGRGYDAVVIHGCWQFHGLVTSRFARKAGVPYFIFPHGMLDPYFKYLSRLKHFKKRIYWPLERSVLENARSVFFTCAEEGARAHEAFSFNSIDQIVPLGLSTPTPLPSNARDEFLRCFPEIAGKRVLLYLGRLHPKKGVDLLIQAFSKIARPGLHLLVAGPVSSECYGAELAQLASPVASQVTFAGMLTGHLKSAALASAEALILPSHQENFGFSAVEALAFGRPVLLSDKVNIWREIVADGAGIVASDTEAGTITLLRKWLALSPEELKSMSAAASSCFESRFRAETASATLLSALQRTISNDRSSLQPVRA